ncbi:MAG: hypothetical protein HY048_20185 [Acidobacteria bacterium]|nr:hypothetical protein [Acidobacteriota bacterium]
MTVLRVCHKHGVRFNEAYYVAKQLRLAGAIFGPHGVTGTEMVKITATPNGAAPSYQVIFSEYFESGPAL